MEHHRTPKRGRSIQRSIRRFAFWSAPLLRRFSIVFVFGNPHEKRLNGFDFASISAPTMKRISITALISAAMLAASSAFAGDHACCAKGASKGQSMACVNLASLNLTPDQRNKIETWQAECMKAGCTKESRQAFLGRAKGILSAEQFAQLKAQCKKMGDAKKTQT